jgi:hypothetical protein
MKNLRELKACRIKGLRWNNVVAQKLLRDMRADGWSEYTRSITPYSTHLPELDAVVNDASFSMELELWGSCFMLALQVKPDYAYYVVAKLVKSTKGDKLEFLGGVRKLTPSEYVSEYENVLQAISEHVCPPMSELEDKCVDPDDE